VKIPASAILPTYHNDALGFAPDPCTRSGRKLDLSIEESRAQIYLPDAGTCEIRFEIELVTDAARRAALNEWLTHKVVG
jgi:hypothetical protein